MHLSPGIFSSKTNATLATNAFIKIIEPSRSRQIGYAIAPVFLNVLDFVIIPGGLAVGGDR